MPNPNPGDPPEEAPTVESLKVQIENLNKGIASYRDESQSSKKEAADAAKKATAAEAEVAKLKKVIEEAVVEDKPTEIKLNPDDEKKLRAWADQQGFVSKEDFEKERGQLFAASLQSMESQAVDEFLKAHPEMNTDESWTKMKEQFALYKQPSSITGYRQVLSRIYKDMKGDNDVVAKARADEEVRKRLGLGGGSQGGAETDTTFEDLQEKYPHLSRETILSRLEEINSLAKARQERNKARKK